ncbi:uncharacterized protein LOC106087352 [Stomoxys calcitrans]|uniref:uncharacterized protein LOC106087352 n=1 Tax=Stomoxys calcitrans TaxID=35570 RepID=UPI0027E32912|nr:uncharacterized protein LOC106087352 [Stomoxys calcitrans]
MHSHDNRIVKFTQEFTKNKELIELCDENKLLLQFARLNIISPERIILLLAIRPLHETCQDISDVLNNMNETFPQNQSMPQGNLYMKLYKGLNYFNKEICRADKRIQENHLLNYQDCWPELPNYLIECEGPPDWFEKSNKDVVCQYFHDIVNCYYIKAAMMCGPKPALQLRTFSSAVMKEVVGFNCKISRLSPQMDSHMANGYFSPKRNPFYLILLMLSLVFYFIYFNV